MATKAELRDRAANELGILRLGQSLQSQDATRINSAFDEVYAQLKKEGLNTFTSSGSCADEITPHIAALMAFSCLNTYGVSEVRYQRIVGAASLALPEIRKLVQPEYESVEDAEDF